MSHSSVPSSTEHEAPPISLEVNRSGKKPRRGLVGTFEGLVAAFGFSTASVFTSPNQEWVPEFAIAHSEITTYTDGHWGTHEYSRWPQVFDREHFHVACIPKEGSSIAPSDDVIWRHWCDDDWTTKHSGIPRMGQLTPSLMDGLSQAAEAMIDKMQACRTDQTNWRRIGDFLTLCIRHCLDRLRLLPAEKGVIICLAAHVQRLVLELAGLHVYLTIVLPRIVSQKDCRLEVLDVLGAHTHDPSVAQTLHCAGVPVWFQQLFSSNVVVWQVTHPHPLPYSFSSTPCYPRLVLAVRDLSGALNTPGEWQRAMSAVVRRQLCASRLPQLLRDDTTSESGPLAKKARVETQWPNEWSSSIGHARPVYVLQNSKDARTLAHDLPRGGPPRTINRKKKARALSSAPSPSLGNPSFVMNPFRQYYESRIVHHGRAWARALNTICPLPQPSKSVTYFFPPPWMLDTLDGYDQPKDRLVRYLHQLVSIRMFCRLRLFDRTIAGRPLTISEWRDTLWGDYTLDKPDDKVPEPSSSHNGGRPSRAKVQHRHQQALRELFGKSYALPSYDDNASPKLGDIEVSAEVAAMDASIQRRLVWEAHETNWRCELLAIDALMVGSGQWPEMERWTREAHVSEVWGPPRSGMDLCPQPDARLAPFCWHASSQDGWQSCRGHLQAFVHLLTRWPSCPITLRELTSDFLRSGGEEYDRIQAIALDFYVATFVEQFQRLPTPPVYDPLMEASVPQCLQPPGVFAIANDSSRVSRQDEEAVSLPDEAERPDGDRSATTPSSAVSNPVS